jgi:hypothetical protein
MGGIVSKVLGGSGGNASAPKAPDYSKLMDQQYVLDEKAARRNTIANNPTQNTYGGSLKYSNKGGVSTTAKGWTPEQVKQRAKLEADMAKYAADGKKGKNWKAADKKLQAMVQGDVTTTTPDDWQQDEVWDENTTKAHDQAVSLADQKQQALLNQGEFKAPDEVTYDATSGDTMANAAWEKYKLGAMPLQEHNNTIMENKLRGMGLQPGTESYDRAYQNLIKANNESNTSARYDSVKIGYDEASRNLADRMKSTQQIYNNRATDFSRPWEMAADAQSMRNSQWTPQFRGFSGAGQINAPDKVGAAKSQYATAMGQANANAGKNSGIMGSVGNIMGKK